jgi:hypothetical protein
MGDCLGPISKRGGREKKDPEGGKGWKEVCYPYTYEDCKMKPIKHCLKEEGGERRRMEIYLESELAQGTLYTCMELSQ